MKIKGDELEVRVVQTGNEVMLTFAGLPTEEMARSMAMFFRERLEDGQLTFTVRGTVEEIEIGQ